MFGTRRLTFPRVCVAVFVLSSILFFIFKQFFVRPLLFPLSICMALFFITSLLVLLFTERISLTLLFILLFVVSFSYVLYRSAPFPGPYGRPVIVRARLLSEPVLKRVCNESTAKIRVIYANDRYLSCFPHFKVLLHLPLKGPPHPRGSIVEVKGFFLDLPYESNPEYAGYLRNRGIGAVFEAYSGQLRVIKGASALSVLRIANSLKAYVKRVNRRLLPYPQSEFAISIFTGSRENLPSVLIELFRRSGTIHILAVSGLHIGFLSFYFFLILKTFRVQQNMAYILLIGLAVFYMIFVGDTPSVKRASIMVMCGIAVFLLDRDRDYLNILSLAFIVLWLLNPLIIQDPGFLLSFSATFGILFLAPHVARILQRGMPLFLAAPLAATFSVQIYVLPVMLAFFKSFSYINMIANLPIVPLAGISLALELLYLTWHPLFLPFANVFAEVNTAVTTAIIRLAYLFAYPRPLSIDYFPVWGIPLYFVALTLGLSFLLKRFVHRGTFQTQNGAVARL